MLSAMPLDLLILRPRNLAYHNLCKANDFPSTIKSFLGLGLNFCFKPTASTRQSDVQIERFRKNLYTRVAFANAPELEKHDLFIPSTGWVPPDPVNQLITNRTAQFINFLEKKFRYNKPAHSNLLAPQLCALQWLKSHPEIMVFGADKNLGPCLIERHRYIEYAWRDHLSDTNTYKKMSKEEVTVRIKYIRDQIDSFHTIFQRLASNELDYIDESTNAVSNDSACSWMYLLAKVHKSPLKTRAIISYSGSLCQGLAIWIDSTLKRIVNQLPFVATSSAQVVKDLTKRKWPTNSVLFTHDAVSMYTNIHLGHALPTIENFLLYNEFGITIAKAQSINVAALVYALEVVMNNNIFRFGDTYWLQTAGTAMGTPPACRWATLYFAIWELEIIPRFPELNTTLYQRYIDDGLAIWTPNHPPAVDNVRFQQFQDALNNFGRDHTFFRDNACHKPLQWEFSKREKTVVFLDLTISLDTTGTIHTTIYEKKLNLYLYLPPHSCHAPGVLKGMIYGIVYRAKALCTITKDQLPYIKKAYIRLLARGHQSSIILPIFNSAVSDIFDTKKKKHRIKANGLAPLFLHLPFNPADPSSAVIQSAFRDIIVAPHQNDHITTIDTGNDFDGKADFDQLIVCYHKQKSIRNVLTPRIGRFGENFSVDAVLNALPPRDTG